MPVTFWTNPERTRELRLAFRLALASVSFLALFISNAEAQYGSIGLYTDATGATCSFSGDAAGPITAYVVVRPDANGLVGVQFAAPIPPCIHATFLSDVVTPGVLAIGSSQTGISLAFPACAGVPYSPLQISYYSTGGTTLCCAYPIVADPSQGSIVANDCAYQNVSLSVVPTHFNADLSCQCIGNSAPAPPSLVSPYDGEISVPLQTYLNWSGYDLDGNLVEYDVYLGITSSPPLIAAGVTQESYLAENLNPLAQYYWRVVARDAFGFETTGALWRFTTRPSNSPPIAPHSPSPAHGEQLVLPNANLAWGSGDIDGDPIVYDVYFGTSSPPPLLAAQHTEPTFEPGMLTDGTTYFWRIVARDLPNTETSGPEWSFTTRVVNLPPNAPTIVYPTSPSQGLPLSLTLDWSATHPDGQLIRFDIYFGTQSPPPLVVSNAMPSEYPVSGLAYATQYFWKIVVQDQLGAEAAGPVWTFTTRPVNFPPQAPSSPSPANVATNVLRNTMLGWQCSDLDGHSIKYDVYFGVEMSPPLVASNVTVKSYAPGLLAESTTYQWRIVARDQLGAETSGPVWSFTTAIGPVVGVHPTTSDLVLHQNQPNPFNPQTMIAYELPSSSNQKHVRLWILDISGRIVATLVDEEQSSGPHDVRWFGQDDRGEAVSSGVYFYVLDVDGARRTRKLVLLK